MKTLALALLLATPALAQPNYQEKFAKALAAHPEQARLSPAWCLLAMRAMSAAYDMHLDDAGRVVGAEEAFRATHRAIDHARSIGERFVSIALTDLTLASHVRVTVEGSDHDALTPRLRAVTDCQRALSIIMEKRESPQSIVECTYLNEEH